MTGSWRYGYYRQRYGAGCQEAQYYIKFSNSLKPILGTSQYHLSLDYEAFEKQMACFHVLSKPCLTFRRDGDIYLDATLTQRSNDMLVAHHINYAVVALQMMIAKHFGWKVGKFFYLSITCTSMTISSSRRRSYCVGNLATVTLGSC